MLSLSMDSKSTDCTLIMGVKSHDVHRLKGSGLYRVCTPGRGLSGPSSNSAHHPWFQHDFWFLLLKLQELAFSPLGPTKCTQLSVINDRFHFSWPQWASVREPWLRLGWDGYPKGTASISASLARGVQEPSLPKNRGQEAIIQKVPVGHGTDDTALL